MRRLTRCLTRASSVGCALKLQQGLHLRAPPTPAYSVFEPITSPPLPPKHHHSVDYEASTPYTRGNGHCFSGTDSKAAIAVDQLPMSAGRLFLTGPAPPLLLPTRINAGRRMLLQHELHAPHNTYIVRSTSSLPHLTATDGIASRGPASDAALAAASPDSSLAADAVNAELARLMGRHNRAGEVLTGIQRLEAKGVRSDSKALQLLVRLAAERMQDLEPKEIHELTTVLARLGVWDAAIKTALIDEIVARMDQFEPSALAGTACALAEAEYYNYYLLTKLTAHAKAHVNEFDAASLAKIVWAVHHLKYKDPDAQELVAAILSKMQAKEPDPSTMADLVFAIGELSWMEPRIADMAAEYAMQHMQGFDGPSLGKLCAGLSMAGCLELDVFAAAARNATKMIDQLRPVDVCRLAQALAERGIHHQGFLQAAAHHATAHEGSYTSDQISTLLEAFVVFGSADAAATSVAALQERLSGLRPILNTE